MICVIFAHPYPQRSQANRVLLGALENVENIDVRPLYAMYPDFDIDIAAEKRALERANLVVWMHPVFWYSVPSLLKHWFDQVLEYGWAYGEGGRALAGKHCLWAVTTGGDERAYSADGVHERAFAEFIAPIEQTARFCGMVWQPPFILHGARLAGAEALSDTAERLNIRLLTWKAEFGRAFATPEVTP